MTEPKDAVRVARLLEIIEDDILPLTEKGVAAGNKVFGAAILCKSDLSLVLAETNNERENPLWHGEVHALKRFHELDLRPDPKELVFLSTHEPCPMCLSAIAWAGFDNFHYFFSHEDSRDSFAIPHDLRMLKEIFRLEPGGYARENPFWRAVSIVGLARGMEGEEETGRLQARMERIRARYAALSQAYQSGKDANAIPLN